MKIFDYIFYRVYSFYKRKGDRNPVLMGVIVLSLLIGLSLLTINTLISIGFKTQVYFSKVILLCIFIFFLLLFGKRYKDNSILTSVKEEFKNENINLKRKHDLYIIVYFLIAMLIPMTVGFLRHNLGWDI